MNWIILNMPILFQNCKSAIFYSFKIRCLWYQGSKSWSAPKINTKIDTIKFPRPRSRLKVITSILWTVFTTEFCDICFCMSPFEILPRMLTNYLIGQFNVSRPFEDQKTQIPQTRVGLLYFTKCPSLIITRLARHTIQD